MNKPIDLIVTDMDGSLLDSQKRVPENIHEMIDKLKQHDILFGICSGRQYASIHQKMDGRNDILYLGENGGICVYQDEVLYFNALPQKSIAEFVKLARSIDGCTPVLCAEKLAYVESNDPKVIEKMNQFYHAYEIVDDLLTLNEPFCKISILDFKISEYNCYPHFKKYEDEFEVLVSDRIWMDICCKGQSKGDTLKKAADQLELSLEKTVAFGDYFNDVEMLQAVKYSFAMENAHPDVKKMARYIAPSNDEQGVIKIIERILAQL